MIDDKKIEEVAINYSQSLRENEIPSSAFRDFKEGAHWAIQELLNGLWHDAKEEPKPKNKKEYIIVQFSDSSFSVCNLDWLKDNPLKNWSPNGVIDKWCYIPDLLPKQKGGEE